MDKGEARARLIALAENTPKGEQRDALIMGATALMDDISNQWLAEHDAKIRAEERAKVLDLIGTMDFDFGDYYDHTSEIKEMIRTMMEKEQK